MPLRLGIGGEVIDENNNTNMHHALEDPVTFTHKGRNRVLQAYGDTVATPSSAGSICLQESSGLELTLTPFGFFYVLLAFVATVLALIWFHFKRRNSNSNAMQEKGKEENYRLNLNFAQDYFLKYVLSNFKPYDKKIDVGTAMLIQKLLS